jgi:Protein of unknown function (DUF3040)
MTLSARQQAILDQIERALAAADPQLKSKFSIFTRLTSRDTMPETENVRAEERQRQRQRSRVKSMVGLLVVSVMAASLIGAFLFSVIGMRNDCPGLPSDQTMASAAVRYAACSHDTAAWSKGSR